MYMKSYNLQSISRPNLIMQDSLESLRFRQIEVTFMYKSYPFTLGLNDGLKFKLNVNWNKFE